MNKFIVKPNKTVKEIIDLAEQVKIRKECDRRISKGENVTVHNGKIFNLM